MTRFATISAALGSLLLLLAAAGCSVDAPSCQSNADCPTDLVCESTGGVLFQSRACVRLDAVDTGAADITDATDTPDATNRCPDGGPPTTLYADKDGDGWGDESERRTVCSPDAAPEDFVDKKGDCAPMDPDRNPEADEVCNEIDDDCDGESDENLPTSTWYRDRDDDGYAGKSADERDSCSDPSTEQTAWVQKRGDCAPEEPTANPEGDEICDDLDNNCNGDIDEGCDDDGDGYCDADMTVAGSDVATCPNGGGDCEDSFEAVNPGANEVCNDGADNDCNGVADDGCACDYTGRTVGVCDDGTISATDGSCTPPSQYEQMETSSNCDGLDNDCDGSTDEGC